jgi:hypothetical protein
MLYIKVNSPRRSGGVSWGTLTGRSQIQILVRLLEMTKLIEKLLLAHFWLFYFLIIHVQLSIGFFFLIKLLKNKYLNPVHSFCITIDRLKI